MTIINYAIIIWTIFVGVVFYFLYGRLFNPCFLMNLIWCVCTTCATFGLFSFRKPSEKTYIYVLIVLVAYSVFSLLYRTLLTKWGKRKHLPSQVNHVEVRAPLNDAIEINVKLYTRILLVIALIFVLMLMPTILKSLEYYIAGDLFSLRNQILVDSQGYMGRFISFFYNYIIRSYSTYLNIMAAYMLSRGYRKSWRFLVLALAGSSMHMILTSGRMLIFELGCYIVLAFLLYKPKDSNTIARFKFGKLHGRLTKRGVFTVIMAVLVTVGAVYVTSLRHYSRLGILGTFWQYSIGSMCYFDLIVTEPVKFGIESRNYLFGQATFGPVFGFIETFKATFFGADYQGPDYLLNMYDQLYYDIAPGIKMNATSTIIYPFLRDWGVAGLVIGPAVIAFAVEFVYRKAELHEKSISWNFLLITMYYMILFSVWRYTLLYSWTYMTPFWLLTYYIFISKKNRSRGNKAS